MNNSDINKDLLLNFLDESLESLNEIENQIITLEKDPENKNIIDQIFRPFHSLKGNASYFGLMKITKLSHKLEDLLDALRKDELILNQEITDLILPGTDLLREMLNNVHNDKPEVSNKRKLNSLIIKIQAMLNNEFLMLSYNKDKIKKNIQMLESHTDEKGKEILSNLTDLLQTSMLEETLPNKNTKYTDGNFLSFLENEVSNYNKKDNALKDIIEKYIDKLADNTDESAVANLREILYTFSNSDTGIDEIAVSLLIDELMKIKPPEKNSNNIQQEDTNILIENEKDSITKKTMRIPIEALDNFLKNVGELLSVEEMLKHFSRQLSSKDKFLNQSIKEIATMFEGVSKNLRTGIMDIRKVEASNLLNKAPRIARDVAVKSDKKISIFCMGEDIKIDKSYIDLLDAPLTHLVRNAADHGIELPEERIAKGKDDTGVILVTITEENGNIILKVSDDGIGLNFTKLSKKAIELGIIDESDMLNEEEITELLFSSGVSTADKITDISGRGVGMDVVKHSIEEAGGKISVNSNENAGTTFIITLPQDASTQIIDGYIIKSFSDEDFVLPLSLVSEAFSINQNDISTVTGKGRIVTRRGIAFPLFNIDNSLGISNNPIADEQRMVIICNLKNKSMALEVKEAVGIQKIVKKDVESGLLDQSLFEGAAVNGRGHIMLIISKDALQKFN